MRRLVLLISPTGKGTNLQTILAAIKNKVINAKIILVISESENSPGVLIAKENSIKVEICRTKRELLPILSKAKPDFVVLCGWKQFIPQEVLDMYKDQILNLHPGVIPESVNKPFKNPDGSVGVWNKGLYADLAVDNFLKANSTYASSSVHFLTDEFDFGPVLGRTFEKIKPDDTIKSLYARLKKKENKLYVEVLTKLCN